MKITQEMKDRFMTRGNEHIARVKRNAIKLIKEVLAEESDIIDTTTFAIQVGTHDKDKFDYPAFIFQVFRGWRSYCKRRDIPVIETTETEEEMIQRTVFTHVKSNKHHPEYWDPAITFEMYVPNYLEDYDNPEFYVVDATRMDNEALAELVCDWTSVAQEFGKECATDWADEMIGKRWSFTDDQINLIYRIIKMIRK